MARKLKPVSPGEMLAEEFLKPLEMSNYRSDGWWLRLQADYDTEVAKAALAKTLAKITPWSETTADREPAR